MAKSIPARSEVDPQFTWAITDMYPSDEAWYEELKTMRGLVADAASYKGRLGESAANLLGFLRAIDAINAAGNKFINYAFRRADEDTRNADYQAMSAQAQNFLVDMSKALAFETPELLAIPDETIDAFFREEPALEHYRLVITRERRKKPHTLSAECEALLAAAGQLSQAPDDIFSMLNDADSHVPGRGGRQGRGAPAHARHLHRLRAVGGPRAARVGVPLALQHIRPVPQHLRLCAERADEATAVLCGRPSL